MATIATDKFIRMAIASASPKKNNVTWPWRTPSPFAVRIQEGKGNTILFQWIYVIVEKVFRSVEDLSIRFCFRTTSVQIQFRRNFSGHIWYYKWNKLPGL